MNMRLVVALVGLSIALPTLDQEQNTVDPEVRQQIEAVLVKFHDAFNKNDLAAIMTFYTQDAVLYDELVYRRYVCRRGGNREMV